MIISEILEDGRIHHYSNLGFYIKQIETNVLYEDAIDIQPCPYTYEESTTPIAEPNAEELLNIIVGGEIE